MTNFSVDLANRRIYDTSTGAYTAFTFWATDLDIMETYRRLTVDVPFRRTLVWFTT